MYIALDLTKRETVTLFFDSHGVREHVSYSGQNRDILLYLHTFLQRHGATKEEVQGIAVIMPTGSFTSTRLAATVANVWHFVQGIPVCSITPDAFHAAPSVASVFQSGAADYIAPSYGAEPHIGISKKIG